MIAIAMLNDVASLSVGRRKKMTAWIAYMMMKTVLRPIMSDTQAQKTRPVPLKMEISPTMPAAATGERPTISWAIGEAWEITMIPAETLQKRISHRTQNWGVDIASATS